MTLTVRSQRRRASEKMEKEVNGFITSREGGDQKERSSVVHVEWLCTGWRRMQMKRGEKRNQCKRQHGQRLMASVMS